MDNEMRGSLLKDADGDVAICAVCGTEFNILLFDMDNFNYCPYCGVALVGGSENG